MLGCGATSEASPNSPKKSLHSKGNHFQPAGRGRGDEDLPQREQKKRGQEAPTRYGNSARRSAGAEGSIPSGQASSKQAVLVQLQ